MPGNRGGGRLPSHIRALARRGLRRSLPEIRAIAEGTKAGARPGDQVQAFRVLADIGLGKEIRQGELLERLIAQVQLMRRWWKAKGLDQQLLDELLEEVGEAWR
jgi:hypothetical protein